MKKTFIWFVVLMGVILLATHWFNVQNANEATQSIEREEWISRCANAYKKANSTDLRPISWNFNSPGDGAVHPNGICNLALGNNIKGWIKDGIYYPDIEDFNNPEYVKFFIK